MMMLLLMSIVRTKEKKDIKHLNHGAFHRVVPITILVAVLITTLIVFLPNAYMHILTKF